MTNLPQFEPISALTGIMYFLLLAGAAVCTGWGIVEYGKGQAAEGKKYDDLHDEIQDTTRLFAHTRENYDLIEKKIAELKALKYKDKERTDVLTRTFRNVWFKEWLMLQIEKRPCHEKPDFGLAG